MAQRYQRQGHGILDTLAVAPAITAFDPDEPTLQDLQCVKDYKAWLAAGNLPDPDPQVAINAVVAAQTVLIAELESAVNAHMDASARARGYDDHRSAISYATSTNATWAHEGAAFGAWRDAVWDYCITLEVGVKSGNTATPSADQLIAALPALVI